MRPRAGAGAAPPRVRSRPRRRTRRGLRPRSCGSSPRARVHDPDRARLAVGDPQAAPVGGEAARLVHGRLRQRTVDERFLPVARVGRDHAALERHRPQLVRAGHGDVERPSRMARSHGELSAVSRAGPPVGSRGQLRARPGERRHGARCQADGAHGVVLGVGDVQRLTMPRQALGLVEAGGVGRPAVEPRGARADDPLDPTAQIGDDDPMMTGVTDERVGPTPRRRAPCRGSAGARPAGGASAARPSGGRSTIPSASKCRSPGDDLVAAARVGTLALVFADQRPRGSMSTRSATRGRRSLPHLEVVVVETGWPTFRRCTPDGSLSVAPSLSNFGECTPITTSSRLTSARASPGAGSRACS